MKKLCIRISKRISKFASKCWQNKIVKAILLLIAEVVSNMLLQALIDWLLSLVN